MATYTHRMTEWLRSLEVIWSSPVLKQGHLQQATQDHVQMAFKYLHGGRCQSFCGQSVPVLQDPHGKGVFSDNQRELPVFHLVSTNSCSATGNHTNPPSSVRFAAFSVY